MSRPIGEELKRLTALWHQHGTVVVDSEEGMTTAEVLAACDELEAGCVKDGVTASFPSIGFILKVVALVRSVAAFVESNPQLEAFVRDLLEQIKALFTSDGGVV